MSYTAGRRVARVVVLGVGGVCSLRHGDSGQTRVEGGHPAVGQPWMTHNWKGSPLKYLVALFFLILALPAAAEPYYMKLARDFEKVGDIASHTDDMDMRMTFVYNYPAWLVEEGLREFLEDGEYGLEKTERNKNDVYMESRWLVQDAKQVPFTLRNANQIRSMLTARIKSLGENKTQIVFTVALQVQETNRITSGWVDRSERLAREYIWIAAASTGLTARYIGNEELMMAVLQDYRKNGKRQGEKGYELPPREVAKQPEVKPDAPGAGGTPATPGSLVKDLKDLKDLLDAGAITPEQYEAAKDKLIKG